MSGIKNQVVITFGKEERMGTRRGTKAVLGLLLLFYILTWEAVTWWLLVCYKLPGGSEVKASAWNVGDSGLIPGSGRSPGEGNGNPLQYSCLENPTDRGAWWVTVHGVAKSQTWLNDFTSLHFSEVKICSAWQDWES